jgi:cytochrome P450 / NADPH-cytochrome P450 reductase
LYSPVQEVKRECATDTVVLGKYLIRKGQRITVLTYGLHRQEEQWDQGVFGDPEVFNPDRHLQGSPARHPNAQVPFGFGVRSCIGMQFALLEAKTFLCMILNSFTIQTPPDFKIIPVGKAGAPTCQNLSFTLRHRPNAALSRVNLSADPLSITESSKPSSAKLTLKKEVLSPGKKSQEKPILILFGSNTGTCEDFARSLSDKAAEVGYKSQIATLDQAVAKNMLTGAAPPGPVLVVTSTYNGMPPDNAKKFAKWMESSAKAGSLTGIKFAVFGVGNSNWASTYQKFPTAIHRYVPLKLLVLQPHRGTLFFHVVLLLTFYSCDSVLASAGARPLQALITADASTAGFADLFDDWAQTVLGVIASQLGLETTKEPETTATKKRSTYIRVLDATTDNVGEEPARDAVTFRQKLYDVYAQLVSADVVSNTLFTNRFEPCLVTETVQLQSEYSDRSTCHVELALPDGTRYEAGDHLAVIGCNSDGLVNDALEVLGMNGDEIVMCNPSQTALERGLPNDLPGVPVTSRLALTWLPDLGAPPSRKNIQRLADAYCRCPPEATALRGLAESEKNYKDIVLDNGLTLAELLTKYKSISVDIEEFCSLLPRINPRYYSISSSPLVQPNRVSITVRLVDFETKSGRHHHGAASSMLHSKEVGSMVLCKVKQLNGQFKLPKDSTTPIIMVGPGTGVAPFMGFLEEREVLAKNGSNTLGPAHLFFGCRSNTTDFIYKDRLESYTQNGVLSSTGLHVAFSRENESKKVYVQDLIAASSEELWNLMQNCNAMVYICGDARHMAPDVKKAFINMAVQHGHLTKQAADAWMATLLSSGRYVEDVYA